MQTPPDFSASQGRSRRPGGCLRNLLAIVGILILAALGLIAFDYLYAPWAWNFGGKPTLVGEWVGSFTLPSGQRGAAYVNLTHNLNDDFRGSRIGRDLPRLRGDARSCYSASTVQTYTVDGEATAAADDVEVGFGAAKPTVPGYALDVLKGAWDGASSLTLSGTFQHILDTKDTTESANEPNQRQPTTVVFHPGKPADFAAACQALGR